MVKESHRFKVQVLTEAPKKASVAQQGEQWQTKLCIQTVTAIPIMLVAPDSGRFESSPSRQYDWVV